MRYMYLIRIVFCLLAFGLFGEAKATPQTIYVGDIKVAAWLPKETAGSPVILFSHGFHGCATQSVFLMQALADAGYAVFAPNHRDAVCFGGASSWLDLPHPSFRKPDVWNDASYADRKEDVEKLLAALPHDPRFQALDWNRLGIAGHSLGGYTVLGLAGGWQSWKDKRVKAVLALSPYCRPFTAQRMLSRLSVPVMYQGGTEDGFVTPYVAQPGGAYDQTSTPKYFVEFKGAAHFAWTDIIDTYHAPIKAYSVAFFDTYLKGAAFPPALLKTSPSVMEIRTHENP